MTVQLYDTTLRDGAQMEGISLSVEDKLRIARRLDELGVHFIEGGFPAPTPRTSSSSSACGSSSSTPSSSPSARPAAPAATQRQTRRCASWSTPAREYVTIVGKAHDLQVREVLETTLEENLAMIGDSVRLLKQQGQRRLLRRRALLRRLHRRPGLRAGLPARRRQRRRRWARALRHQRRHADRSSLEAIEMVQKRFPSVHLGIHCHNDAEVAVANTLAAVEAGVSQVQACINGYGERCGNANMCQRHRRAQAQAGPGRRHSDEQLSTPDRGLPLRQRGGEPGALAAAALRRRQRLRAQGRLPHRRRASSDRLPAHRPGGGRQRAAHAGLRAGRQPRPARQGRASSASTTRLTRDDARR